jgi:prophage antirepressor-like protein
LAQLKKKGSLCDLQNSLNQKQKLHKKKQGVQFLIEAFKKEKHEGNNKKRCEMKHLFRAAEIQQ